MVTCPRCKGVQPKPVSDAWMTLYPICPGCHGYGCVGLLRWLLIKLFRAD